MKRSAVLACVAMLILAGPTGVAAQNPPAPSEGTQARAQLNSIENEFVRTLDALGGREMICDIPEAEYLLNKLVELRKSAKTLNDVARSGLSGLTESEVKRTNYVYEQIKSSIVGHQRILANLREKCPKKAAEPEADIGAVQSTTPAKAAKPEVQQRLEDLFGQAQSAFNAHYQFSVICDRRNMAAQQAKLDELAREARRIANALRAVGVTAAMAPASAQQIADAIAALANAARGRPALNCPGSTGTAIQPPPPQPPPPPSRGSQDCPTPGAPGGMVPGKSAPEHGMRFTPPDGQSQRMLASHNRARAEVGATPLIWDRELAAGAAAYAAQMSTVGRVHAPRAGRKCVRENLLQSLRGGRSPEQMIAVWTNEKAHFKPGIFPNVSTTGNWAKVGHYTQVIWSTTTHVGCAVHSDARHDWTVCRYSPPGNQDGRPVL